jgi:hypothetical protein
MRLLCIALDGGRADRMYDWMGDGTLPHFAALAAQGVRAEYARLIDPSLTAAAHNSIATGATRCAITSCNNRRGANVDSAQQAV